LRFSPHRPSAIINGAPSYIIAETMLDSSNKMIGGVLSAATIKGIGDCYERHDILALYFSYYLSCENRMYIGISAPLTKMYFDCS
jgi:hypothetical protein